jgi:serine protease Do
LFIGNLLNKKWRSSPLSEKKNNMISYRVDMKRIISCVLLLIFGAFGSLFAQTPTKPNSVPPVPIGTQPSILKALSDEVAQISQKIKPSVVTVSTTSMFDPGVFFYRGRFFRGEQKEIPRGMGTGIIVDGNYVLTNNHVVEGGSSVYVKFTDGRKVKGKVVGADPNSDVAVIKIEGVANLVPATLGDSDSMRTGDWVLAIGNPLALELSVTTGIISATGRSDVNITDFADFIQTSAPINPGNSGGPLVNYEGKVIGINTAIIGGAQGLGFAIPINMAKGIMQSLIKEGKVVRGYLGVRIQEITSDLSSELNLKTTRGALIANVEPSSPAHRAGLQKNDVILRFAGKEIDSPRKLTSVVGTTAVGQEVDVTVLRGGKELSVKAKIAATTLEAQAEKLLGIEVSNVDKEVADRYGYEKGVPGVVVTGISPQGKGAQVRLREGDLIYGINDEEVRDEQSYEATLAKLVKEDVISFYIVRGQRRFEVPISLR